MILEIVIAFIVGGGVGFGIGRIKNDSKLTAISTEISALEAKALSAAGVVKADVLAAIAKIKTWL